MTHDKQHVLVIEDEPKIAKLLRDYLERENYAVNVLDEGTEAVETIQTTQPTLVLLDLMLPGKDGLSICREVRQFSQVPIVIITAKVDEIDRLVGLEIGADDYICKPFSPREVVARIKTIMRRVHQSPVPANDNTLAHRNVTLHLDKYECMANEQNIDLTPVEFRLLHALMRRPGHVFSREKLMDAAYTDGRIVSDRTIDTHIKNVRKKLNQVVENDDLLHSIYGVGYKVD